MKRFFKFIPVLSLALVLAACSSDSKAPDTDNDGVSDSRDAFPQDARESKDTDGDGVGDNADIFPQDATETLDTDNDTVGDNADNCLTVANTNQIDQDGDNVGDVCDDLPQDATETTDTDNDGVGDNADAFPQDATETLDTDNDTIGDNTDNCLTVANTQQLEQDGDTVGDACDAFPQDATETTDTDNDGTGDNADVFPQDATETLDTDTDTIGDNADNCPLIANTNQINTDGNFENSDAFGDACDADNDNDGTLDVSDIFPLDPDESIDEDTDQIGDNKDLDITSANNQVENSISLTRLLATGRATRFIGTQANSNFSSINIQVVNAGDVNKDGFDDMLVSIPGYKQDPAGVYYTGIVYLFFGGVPWPETINLNNIPADVPHVIFEKQATDDGHTALGLRLAALGDVNGDTIDDFAISAHKANSSTVSSAGAVHIVYGRTTWLTDAGDDHTISYARLKLDYARNFYGDVTSANFGYSLVNVGDVNGDGLADIAVGQPRFNSAAATLTGRLYILFGGPQFAMPTGADNRNVNVADLPQAQRMRISNSEVGGGQLGYQILPLGNFDNDADNTHDFLAQINSAKEYHVILGQKNPPANIELPALIADHGFVIDGGKNPFDDVTVGNLLADDANTPDILFVRRGITSVIKGGVGNWPALIDIENFEAEYGITVPLTLPPSSSPRLTMLPDSNKDGLDEPLFSTFNNADGTGRVQKILDTANWVEQPSTPITVNSSIQNIISDVIGSSFKIVETLGDMDNDGQVEFVLNAPFTDTQNGDDSGDFFVVKGFAQVYPQ